MGPSCTALCGGRWRPTWARKSRQVPAPFKTEAVVLRSIRYGEADRILHLYSRERGRIGAIAKGARRGKSRLGGRPRGGKRGECRLGGGARATLAGEPDPARGARRPLHGDWRGHRRRAS